MRKIQFGNEFYFTILFFSIKKSVHIMLKLYMHQQNLTHY